MHLYLGATMSTVLKWYHCRNEFFLILKNYEIVRRCPVCFKSNRIRTIVGGKAQCEYFEDAKCELQFSGELSFILCSNKN